MFVFSACLVSGNFAERISPQRMQALLASPKLLKEFEVQQEVKRWQRQKQQQLLRLQKQREDLEYENRTRITTALSTDIRRMRGPSSSPSSGYESHDNLSICSGDTFVRHRSPLKSLAARLTSTYLSGEHTKQKAKKRRRSSSTCSSSTTTSASKKRKQEYVVEAIESMESVNGEPLFYVKWLNYSKNENTWETLSNLSECALLEGFIESMMLLHKTVIDKITNDIEEQIKVESLALKVSDINFKDLDEYDPLKLRADLILLAQFINAHSRCQREPDKIRKRALQSMLLEPWYYKRKQQLSSIQEWQERMNLVEHKSPIAVENNVDFDILDPNFQYIAENFAGKDVEIGKSPTIGCKCVDGCAPSSKCCARMASSYFAYEKNGRLRLYPGEAIYECNSACQCTDDCANRVIQKGRQNDLCLFKTANGRGWGVRAVKPLRKGVYVSEYMGEIITVDEADERGKKYDAIGRTYLFDLDYNSTADSLYTIDAAIHGNIGHFFNHSCDPNLSVFPFWIDNLDINMPRLAFFTLRPIKAGEELTFDYIRGYIDEDEYQNLSEAEKVTCRCGADNCRKVLF